MKRAQVQAWVHWDTCPLWVEFSFCNVRMVSFKMIHCFASNKWSESCKKKNNKKLERPQTANQNTKLSETTWFHENKQMYKIKCLQKRLTCLPLNNKRTFLARFSIERTFNYGAFWRISVYFLHAFQSWSKSNSSLRHSYNDV